MENILQFIMHDLLSACCTLNKPTVHKAVVQTHCISVPREKQTDVMKDWDINRVFDVHKYRKADLFRKVAEGIKEGRLFLHGPTSPPPVANMNKNHVLMQRSKMAQGLV